MISELTQLRKKRMQALLTPAQLANLAGVRPQLVRQQERIGIRSIRVAKRYAAALDCDPLELLEVTA